METEKKIADPEPLNSKPTVGRDGGDGGVTQTWQFAISLHAFTSDHFFLAGSDTWTPPEGGYKQSARPPI